MPTRRSSNLADIFKGGIDQKALEQRAKASRATGDRLGLAKGETKLCQFYGDPSEEEYWKEFKQHVWKENGKWFFVPCKGEANGCDLCNDERDNVAKTSDGFVAAVWSFKDKAPKVLGGPQNMLTRIIYRYRRAENKFTRRTWEITRFNTDKTEYDVSQGEERPISLAGHPAIDLQKYLLSEIERYESTLTTNKKKRGPTSLDDDDDMEEDDEDEELEDDEDEEEDGPTKDELMDREEYPLAELKDYAKEVGVKISPDIAKNRKIIVTRIIKRRGF